MTHESLHDYIHSVAEHTLAMKVTTADGNRLDHDGAVQCFIDRVRLISNRGGRTWFIGNGGSAGIASHMANDFAKNGGIRAAAITDPSVLTCLANDFGFELVYAKALEFQASPGDGLVAISSSGSSPNILNAVKSARQLGCWVTTMSGFKPTNKLRAMGDLNFYVGSMNYGTVEDSHQMMLHAFIDISKRRRDLMRVPASALVEA